MSPTQKLKSVFLILSYQEIGSSLVSFGMIFDALQSEFSWFKFHSLGSKILKIPEFNLIMKGEKLCTRAYKIFHLKWKQLVLRDEVFWRI